MMDNEDFYKKGRSWYCADCEIPLHRPFKKTPVLICRGCKSVLVLPRKVYGGARHE